VTTPFAISNIISFIISIYFGKKYILDEDYRELGFCYTRIIQEFFNVIYSAVVMYIYINKETFIKPSLALLKENLWAYVSYNIKTAFSFYGECFAFELNTYFAARFNDLDQLAGYVAIINCMIYVFFISIGFSNTFRTLLGNTLGEGQIQRARANNLIYTVYVAIFSIIILVIVEIYRPEIAFIYIGNTPAISIVEAGILAYYWNVFPTFILYSQSSVMRFLNKNGLAVQTTAIIMPIFVIIFSGILAFKMDMKTVGLIYGFFGSKLIALIIFFYVIYTVDWKKNYLEFKKDNESNKNE
jgi:Na+-driven multidrug efflux pump